VSLPPADVPLIPRDPPLLIVLSGPSGAGKDTVRDLILEWYPTMHRVVTATTRDMRPGEVAGRDYHFVSEADFDKILETGGFIEHAVVYHHRNGVPRIEIEDPLALGVDAIARVDVQGARTLRSLIPDALLIFIAPPSVDEGVRRMRERNTDSKVEQQRRGELAQQEMDAAADFDYAVVNKTGQVEQTARTVLEIIAAEKKRRGGE
jgi:guanylate kinase